MPRPSFLPRFRFGELQVLALPPLLWLAVFFLAPVAIVLAFGFSTAGLQDWSAARFTLAHYRQALDPLYLQVVGRSLW